MLKSTKTVCGVDVKLLSNGSGKKVTLVCDWCSRETVTVYANYTRSVKPDGKTMCRWCASKKSGKAKKGKPLLKSRGPRPHTRGENSCTWKGGRHLSYDGYVLVYIGPKKYRKEHDLVVEKALGREIVKPEMVHHINLVRADNDVKNLILLADEHEHRKLHAQLDKLMSELIQDVIVVFDRKTKMYKAVGKLRELLEQPGGVNQQPSRSGDTPEGSTTRGRVSKRR